MRTSWGGKGIVNELPDADLFRVEVVPDFLALQTSSPNSSEQSQAIFLNLNGYLNWAVSDL